MPGWTDGAGRLTPSPACATFDADVLVLEESWTNDADGPGSGQAERIAAALGYQVVTCPLAEGRLAPPHPDASGRWLPRLGFRAEKRALYLSSVRPLPARELASARYAGASRGRGGSPSSPAPGRPGGGGITDTASPHAARETGCAGRPLWWT